jgi:hypothetical protein
MVERNDVMPLLDAIAVDPDPGHRLLLLDALSALPLTPDAWREVGPIAARLLKDLVAAGGLDDAARAVLARIPLRSLRERLRRIAADASRADALPMARALAAVHDAAGLAVLLAAHRDAPSEPVAKALASLPLETLGVAAAELAPGLGGDEMTRCWTAIAMARAGEYEPLEQLWDALVSVPGRLAGDARPHLLTEPPPIFHGDPALTVAALQALGPQPARLQAYVAGLMRSDFDAGGPLRPEATRDDRDAALLVQGLTTAPPSAPAIPTPEVDPVAVLRATKAARRRLASPWRPLDAAWEDGERPWLGATPPELAAEVVEKALLDLRPERIGAAAGRVPEWALGNWLLDLVTPLPDRLPLRGTTLVRMVEVLPGGARPALAWTAARLGATAVLRAFSPEIVSRAAADRGRWLGWLRSVAVEVDAPAPYAGAGGESTRPPTGELIDDVSRGVPSGTPQPRSAPPASAPLIATAPVIAPASVIAPVPVIASTPEPILMAPRIATPDAHPVAGADVPVTITLAVEASPETFGRVRLPGGDPETVHVLQVHALFGEQSAWSELKHSQARGTFEPATFAFTAPAGLPRNTVLALRANFYLDQRWCGEGVRHLDIRPDVKCPSLDPIPAPTPPDWHEGLALEPGALPPDLIVRIQKSGGPGEYRWSCLSPHLNLAVSGDPGDATMSLGSDAETWVRNMIKPLTDKQLADAELVDVDGIGEVIYKATPPVFKRAYWAVWQAARAGGFRFESIQLVTDEPYVPWELMRVADDAVAPDDDPVMLSVRHAVGRWLAGQSGGLKQRIPVQAVAVSASDYAQVDGVAQKLPWASVERQLMVGTYHALDVPLQSAPLLAFLIDGKVQAVHFACHGKMSIAAPDTSFLVLEDTPNVLKPPAIGRTEVRRGLGKQRPLIFLNACEVGGTAASLAMVAGFPAAFLSAGAAAVVCPLWAVNDERAMRIAKDFYARVLVADGEPLGRVLRDVRAAWRDERHLTYLAYVLYGDPLAQVHYVPPAT